MTEFDNLKAIRLWDRENPLRTTPMLYGADWNPLGHLIGDVQITPDPEPLDRFQADPDAPWVLPTSGSFSAQVTLTDVKIDVVAWMMGWPAIWFRRPRMKRRAARRVAGYTRTGRNR